MNAALRDLHQRCAEVCEKQHMALVRRAYMKLHSWPRAHDAVQEAYLRVCSLTEAPPIVSMRAYLNKIVDNVAFDWMRMEEVRTRDKHLVQRVVEGRANPTPEDILLEEEFRTCFRAAVNELPPKSKAAFTLMEIQKQSVDVASAEVGVVKTAMYQLIHRSYGYLAKSMSKQGW